jgi:hypothetical protein
MTRLPRFALLALVLALAAPGCGGDDEGGLTTPRVNILGHTHDDFTDAPVAGATIAVDELVGVSTFTAANGTFTLATIPGNATYHLVGSATNYRPTRNEPLAVGTINVNAHVAMIAAADATRQYTGLGRTAVGGTAIVIVDLRDDGNAPRTGIPVADITLVDGASNPVGVGPYVFGAAGDMVDHATLGASATYGGRSRVGFLDVPPGTHTLRVTVAPGQTLTATVVASAGGVTLVRR